MIGEDCERMFLRGVLDGDGNIHIKHSPTNKCVGGQFRVVKGSVKFIEGLVDFINYKFETDYNVSVAKVNGVQYPKLEMHVADSLKFYNWVYRGFESFRFKDKYSKYKQLIG